MEAGGVWSRVYFSPWMDYHIDIFCKKHHMSRSAAIEQLLMEAWRERNEDFKPKDRRRKARP